MNIVRPNRVSRTRTQHWIRPPAETFPLLCPVREADWIEGWTPGFVASESGVCERDCVFTTAADVQDAVWYVTRHEPDKWFVEMVKITPQVTACKLTIQLRPAADGGTDADVTYLHTSLGPAGDAFVNSFTEDHYRTFMGEWEARMNHYLGHGTRLHPPKA